MNGLEKLREKYNGDIMAGKCKDLAELDDESFEEWLKEAAEKHDFHSDAQKMARTIRNTIHELEKIERLMAGKL